MAIDPEDMHSVRTLRLLAGYTQERTAELAGVSVRTWRRYETRGAPPVVVRWLRFECGMVQGWPNGWRVYSDGVFIPGIGHITFGMIEGAAWVFRNLSNHSEQLRNSAKHTSEVHEAAAEALQSPDGNVVSIKRSG